MRSSASAHSLLLAAAAAPAPNTLKAVQQQPGLAPDSLEAEWPPNLASVEGHLSLLALPFTPPPPLRKMSDGARKVLDCVRNYPEYSFKKLMARPEYILKDSSRAQSLFYKTPGRRYVWNIWKLWSCILPSSLALFVVLCQRAVKDSWQGAHTEHMGKTSQDVKRLKNWEFYPLYFGFY